MSLHTQFFENNNLNQHQTEKQKLISSTNHLTVPKWLSYYHSAVTTNNRQYHYVSNPSNRHQKVSVIVNDNYQRPVIMYFELEESLKIDKQNQFIDKTKLKDFSYLDYLENQSHKIYLDGETIVKDSQWVKKYQPQKFYDLLTQQIHNRNILTWLKSWDTIVFHKQAPIITPQFPTTNKFFVNNKLVYQRNANPNQYQAFQYNHNKLLLLAGPPGCGKTTLVRVLGKHCGYDVVQLNASDDRSAKALIGKIQALGKSNSIRHGNKPVMIVVDQVDGALQHDGNGIRQVLNYIQNGGEKQQKIFKNKTKEGPKPVAQNLPKNQNPHHSSTASSAIPRPIIFICNDPFVKGLKQLRQKSIVIYFRQLDKQKVVKRLKQIIEQQKVYIEYEVLNKIAEICSCDIRSCLGVLQYVCHAKIYNKLDPKDVVNKLKVSFCKDQNTSISNYINSLMNSTKVQKKINNLKQFSNQINQVDNKQLLFEMFYHNILNYKSFLKKSKQSLEIYKLLTWSDVLMKESFKYNYQTDVYLMIVFLYYKTNVVNDQVKKIQFPSIFFEKLNKTKTNKALIEELVSKWPDHIRVTVSQKIIICQYLYLLYYALQTSSSKERDIMECVGKMLTYGIQLAHRNSYNLFKPQIDSLLIFGGKKLDINLSNTSRTLIQQAYQYSKQNCFKILSQLSFVDLNKQNIELMSQLHIKNRRKVRTSEGGVKYKYLQGSGTQITYDLKFRYFFT